MINFDIKPDTLIKWHSIDLKAANEIVNLSEYEQCTFPLLSHSLGCF